MLPAVLFLVPLPPCPPTPGFLLDDEPRVASPSSASPSGLLPLSGVVECNHVIFQKETH